jgi:hypothetical protein
VKKLLICMLMLICWASLCQATPDLGFYYDIQGVRVYKDHKQSEEWYLSPAQPILNERSDKTPDYGLALYRYLGRKGTSDSGNFWVRGVLTFGIERSRDSGLSAKIRKELRTKGISSPRLKSMPVSASRVTLLFSDQKYSKEYNIRWKSGAMVVPLDARIAEVLWDAVQAGQTQVSVSVDETLTGVRKKEENWEPSTTSLTWTLPVEMSMTAHPDHFQRLDLGGRMKVGYTGLDVFCFDFIENLEENLYAKIVEVAIPTTGRDLVETVTFKDNGEYRSRIEFKLAKDLDRPYRYRILRIWQDGSKDTGQWQEKTGETLLDVTAYRHTNDATEETGDK